MNKKPYEQKYVRPTVMRDNLKAVHNRLRNRILIVVGGALFLIGTAIHLAVWYL